MSKNSNIFSIPNLLTFGRIVAIPFIIFLALAGDENLRWIALALYVVAALTDFLDGYLARKWNQTSPIGQMLDPIADKLLVGALLIAFAWDGTFSALDLIPAIAIMIREIFISGLREFLGNKKVILKVTMLAKYKTTVQLCALGILFAEPLLPGIMLVSDIFLWTAAILTLWTGLSYLQAALPHMKE